MLWPSEHGCGALAQKGCTVAEAERTELEAELGMGCKGRTQASSRVHCPFLPPVHRSGLPGSAADLADDETRLWWTSHACDLSVTLLGTK